MLRGLKQNLVCTWRPARDWARPAFECLSVSCGVMGQQWPAAGAGALGAAELGVLLALREEVTVKPTKEPPELTLDWGNRLLEGTNKIMWAPGPRRKQQWPHKRLTQTCLCVSRSLWQRHGLAMVWCRIGSTECNSACMGPFEGAHHYLHYLYSSLVSGQTTGREHSLAYQQKTGSKIYWAGPTHQNKTQFPHSQSLPSGNFHKPLILVHQREERMKTTTTEN